MVTTTATLSTDALIAELRERRDFPRLAPALMDAYTEEQRRRDTYERAEADAPLPRREFINGQIVEMEPVRKRHYDVTDRICDTIKEHLRATGIGGEVAMNSLMCRFDRNNFYPDVAYWPAEVAERFTAETTVFPPPSLAVEVLSESTAARDRGVKFETYEADGVGEYLIVDAEAGVVEQYAAAEGGFELRGRHEGGTFESVAVTGLRLDLARVFA